MQKISCFIITKNEERNIKRTIAPLKKICDEIIIIDSGSEDKTCKIAAEEGAKIVYNKWEGYLNQKIFGESLCRNDWILNLDADEELSPELAHEIEVILAANLISRYKAYRLNIVSLLEGEIKPRYFAPSIKPIRLYNKKYGGFYNNKSDQTHDSVVLNPSVDSKQNIYNFIHKVHHRSWASLTHLISKSNFYSSEQADSLYLKGRKISNLRLIFEQSLWFLKAYFIRRYFVLGIDGFVFSSIFAFSRFARIAKLKEKYGSSKLK
ncbi:MAG: glycosyltransferase family 2 protein [Rickettsiaceae bacterium]|nr:glycosyltransferase family 2 protein [Rickettsiaceae bacterium]